MGSLIDSSVLIAAERGQLDLDAVLGSWSDDHLGIAAITVSEVLHGVHRIRGMRRAVAQGFVDRWLAVLPVIPFDLQVARTHATLAADLGRKGTPMGAHDLIIAATAVWLGYDVATRDRRSFHRIKGLTVRHW